MINEYSNFISAIQDKKQVSGLTHNYYKYPARFSPTFSNSAIETFTEPGELVLDPFVGGGTTLVEASCLGRRSIGVDISKLATFISLVKTTPLNNDEINYINDYKEQIDQVSIYSNGQKSNKWSKKSYQRNLNDRQTWRIRNLIENTLWEIEDISDENISNFLRCAILNTGQWALDGRRTIPKVNEFRDRLKKNIEEMLHGIVEYTSQIERSISRSLLWENGDPTKILNRTAVGLDEENILQTNSPKLILMSPPYPGIHVLYHRWQIRGRRETPAPFWIANKMDGNGASFYTFGDRNAKKQNKYFREMQKVFNSLANISNNETIIVQLIAFSNPLFQLRKYLKLMENAGFEEIFLKNKITHKRLWRRVPNRKWYADQLGKTASSKEVVLLHRLINELT